MEWLNYHHLLYFWTVAREGTIARASLELRLAQPTISGQIRALEDQLGEKLFQRSGRNLVLTEMGRVVYRYADDIFSIGRELMDTLRDRPTGRPMRFQVGVADEVTKIIAYRLLEPALRLPAPIQIVCRDGAPERLLTDLATHALDLVIADTPVSPSIKVKVFSHALGETPVTVFGTSKLAVPRRKNFPRSLDGAPFLVPTIGKTLRRTLDQFFEQQQIRPRIVAELDDSALLTTFGQAGTGLFVAPTVLEKEVMRQFGVTVVGRLDAVRERYFAISVERRLKHPAVVAISEAANEMLGTIPKEVARQHLPLPERRISGMTRWLSVSAFLVAATIAVGAQQRPTLSVPYSEFKLPNGLNVILHRDASVPVVTVNVWYHVGSGNERPGRTGFAHLFEHVMFEGSMHVPEGQFDEWLEAAGGNNNGSTTNDRTNYYEDLPASALELALFLESDRMGFLLDDKAPDKINGQRDVVKNEKRQSVDNQPYGQAFIELAAMLYPTGHPYSWSTIGSMEDLTAASFEDVARFFRTYYVPSNASLVIAGDIDIANTRKLVEKWFSDVPAGKPVPTLTVPTAVLDGVKKKTITDRVQLPRLYLAWHTPPLLKPGDAEMDIVSNLLTGGKNSRLYRRLVYDLQIAQDVNAFQQSQALGSSFLIMATARPGQSLDKIQSVIDEEIDKLRAAPPEAREMERALNQFEANFYRGMERVGGFGGKANQLNAYYMATREPDYFQKDLDRYRALTAADIKAAVEKYLPKDRRVELSVVPGEKK